MSDCNFESEHGPFYCATHGCGIQMPGGAIYRCLQAGCPHCRTPGKKLMTGAQYNRLIKEHGESLEAVIRWEDKLGRVLGGLQRVRLTERRLRLKLEKAEREGLESEPEEDV
jgi:hypothetical protein